MNEEEFIALLSFYLAMTEKQSTINECIINLCRENNSLQTRHIKALFFHLAKNLIMYNEAFYINYCQLMKSIWEESLQSIEIQTIFIQAITLLYKEITTADAVCFEDAILVR